MLIEIERFVLKMNIDAEYLIREVCSERWWCSYCDGCQYYTSVRGQVASWALLGVTGTSVRFEQYVLFPETQYDN